MQSLSLNDGENESGTQPLNGLYHRPNIALICHCPVEISPLH